ATSHTTSHATNNIKGSEALLNGSTSKGAKGKNNVTLTNDTITGPALTVDIENQAGEEGSGSAGRGPGNGSVNHTAINGVNFTGGGKFTVTQADRAFYEKPPPHHNLNVPST